MKKNIFFFILIFFLILFQGLGAQETDKEQKQADTKKQEIKEEWQTNIEAFAKLFFGDDLKVRAPREKATILKENTEVIGARVEWTLTYGISPSWFGLPKEIQSTHSTPRAEARGMLRVNTERRLLPQFKNWGFAPRTYKNQELEIRVYII